LVFVDEDEEDVADAELGHENPTGLGSHDLTEVVVQWW
jgi:hypothetical protein